MRSMPFALYPLLRAGADGIVAEMVLGGVPVGAQRSVNTTGNHEVWGSIPGLAQRVKDPVWLWLW